MKYIFLFLVLLATAFSELAQQNDMLADALKQNSIPLSSIPRLNSKITSYAVLNDEHEFVIAYYLANDKNELRWPLFISTLDKKSGKWQNAELKDVKLVTQGTGTIWDGHSMDCIGSVLSVEEYERRYYLNLHFNPSAGCLVVLNAELSVEKTLPGGTAAFIAGRVLWSMNMVHFADVHPEELWMYSPATHRSKRVYPQTGDPFRKDFEERLSPLIDKNKCATNNWACDPSRFSSELGRVEVNDETKAFAFQVSFSAEGFESMEDAKNSVEKYVYIYRLDPLAWRAFSIYDLKPKFGTDSLRELLTPEKLAKIFATPAN